MHNEITNRLTVTAPSGEQLREFWSAVGGEPDDYGEPRYLSFQKIEPLPETEQLHWLAAKRWATLVDAYDQIKFGNDTVEFQTAWDGVPELMQKLSEQFPDILLEYIFTGSERGINTGSYHFLGGECVSGGFVPDCSSAAYAIAEELLGESLDDVNYDDEEDEEYGEADFYL